MLVQGSRSTNRRDVPIIGLRCRKETHVIMEPVFFFAELSPILIRSELIDDRISYDNVFSTVM